MQSLLSKVTDHILSPAIESSDLEKALSTYKSILLEASTVDFNDYQHQSSIQLENGFAIGLKWAASCLDDTLRTQKLILGTKLAIDQKLKESSSPVHLLYAGTGPFATLILPLLTHFSSKELRVTLLEIHPESVKNVEGLVQKFGFGEHVAEIRCADATKTVFEEGETFDILLSETMQHALQGEQQVIICSHLLNQMSENALLIPASINLELVAINSFGTSQELTRQMGEIMKVDAFFLRENFPMNCDWAYEVLCDISGIQPSDFLAISTSINVHGNIEIKWNESGLTIPKILGTRTNFAENNSLRLRYVLDPEPRFEIVTF